MTIDVTSYKSRLAVFLLSSFILLLALRPFIAYLNLWRGDQMIMNGNFQKAKVQYGRALFLLPKNPEVLSSIGYAYSKLGKHKEAAYFYTKAAKAKPNDAEILFLLGLALFQAGEYREAIKNLEKSVKSDSSNPAAWQLLATSYEKVSEKEKAIQTWERIKKTLPNLKERANSKIEQLKEGN